MICILSCDAHMIPSSYIVYVSCNSQVHVFFLPVRSEFEMESRSFRRASREPPKRGWTVSLRPFLPPLWIRERYTHLFIICVCMCMYVHIWCMCVDDRCICTHACMQVIYTRIATDTTSMCSICKRQHICLCTHSIPACVHTQHTCTHTQHTCMRTHTAYLHVYTHRAYLHVYTHSIPACVHTQHTCMYTRTAYLHVYTHTCTHTHTHTQLHISTITHIPFPKIRQQTRTKDQQRRRPRQQLPSKKENETTANVPNSCTPHTFLWSTHTGLPSTVYCFALLLKVYAKQCYTAMLMWWARGQGMD